MQLNFQNAILGRSYWEAEAKKRRQIEVQVANHSEENIHNGVGFQNVLQYLNDIDASKAGSILSDSINLDDKEEALSQVHTGERSKISNPVTSNFVESKYMIDNGTSDAWICRTCGRSNKFAKDRCATCKTKKSFST